MKPKNILLPAILLVVALSAKFALGQDHFIVGQEEGEGLLVDPSQIEEGPDGDIYVFDRSDAFIKVYSIKGKYLRRIGGKGEGPGELKRADGASFGFTLDKKLYFTEYFGGHNWITLMELSGKFQKAIPFEITGVFGISGAFPLIDGGFLIEYSFSDSPERRKDYFLYSYNYRLVRINSEGEVIAEIIKKKYFATISGVSDGADQRLPYVPAFAWTAYEDDRIVFSDGSSRNLNVFDYHGVLTKEIRTDLPEPEKVTSKDLERWRKSREETSTLKDKAWFERFGRVIEKYEKSIYGNKPILSGISLTPERNIIVLGPASFESDRITYWLLGKNGKTLATANWPIGDLNICKHFIFFTTEDEGGNIRVHCLRRTGSEVRDFQKINTFDSPG
jgi:hypothetical protein